MDMMDRIFWGMVGFIGLQFILLGGVERYINYYIGTAISFAFLIWFIGWGYRIFDRFKKDER
ncbi:MAG: hypothetical protein RIC87_10635 [Kiloniellales bacterium]